MRARWFTDLGGLSDVSFHAAWEERVPHGVPGPVYAVSSGPDPTPTETVACVADVGFVWRQPRSTEELEDTVSRLSNGWLSPGDLGIDGDAHWTLDGIRAWWMRRATHAAVFREAGILEVAKYFEYELPAYLRAYAFFVSHGRRAAPGDELPVLDGPLSIAIPPPTGEVTSALHLLADQQHLMTARRLVRHALPFWGTGRALDVPGVFGGGSPHALGVCPGPHPFLYRQPGSSRELEQVIAAAIAEPWAFVVQPRSSARSIRTWWETQREPMRVAMREAGLAGVDAYVDGELADYLRGYMFVVMHGRPPQRGEELPPLVEPPSPPYPPLTFLEPHHLPFTRGVLEREPATGSGRFDERNVLNVPGMFYGADTDTCGTGPIEAEANVALDASGQEFVFRQPRDVRELAAMYCAMSAECCDGYGNDGNRHWTVELVRAWWAEREAHRAAWLAADVPDVDALFAVELPRYLRGYLFLLANDRPPNAADELPDL